MQDTISLASLAREFRMHSDSARAILDSMGVSPVATVPLGKRTMRLYDPVQARDAISAGLSPTNTPKDTTDKAELHELTATVQALREQIAQLHELMLEHCTRPTPTTGETTD